MEFVGQPLTGMMLRNAHAQSIEGCSRVLAAVAYAQNDLLWWFQDCLSKSKPLEFYGRYDGSCPIDTRLLEWALQSQSHNLAWRVVPKYLHAKVIWWEGKGAYIGSANLTDRAWNNNFEAGIYVDDGALETYGLVPQLLAFFEGLHTRSEPLRQEHLDAQRVLEKRRDQLRIELLKIESQFDECDPLVKGTANPIAAKPKRDAAAFHRFAKEWHDTLQLMRSIADTVSQPRNRPTWIGADVPSGIQADQFLHAYYYRQVRATGEKDAYLSFYDRNRKNKEMALSEAIAWWRDATFDPWQERRTIEQWAPIIRSAFARDRILELEEKEWIDAISRVHAFGQHALHVSNTMIGLPPDQSLDIKTETLAKWMWHQRTLGGKSPIEVVHYVIWGGSTADTVERLWRACNDPAWRLGHMKTSILGELIGWVNPDHFPPRNQRTSKGLKALGFDVHVAL